ncbi:thioredoxin domain-containing protein [Mucisphaera sp.]|uniref:thioredoxin domain-containing protein n=1 Tax=Mucisphaera sp. TaxID=2913024 RepID=UPI003D1288A2
MSSSQPNRLAEATSPYLLQHAYNPVDWYPWGEEAFEAARASGRPIFLSVGYSTCYWCHVMEREIFEKPVMAALMNELFINVKVDREELPDVDDVYMTAVQAMTRRGGWPMSVFLTPPGAEGEDDPGLRPFWAATYLPPEPAHGMPSFPQVLQSLAKAWREQRQEVLDQARQLAEVVKGQLEHREESGEPGESVVQEATDQLVRQADGRHGGYGGAPKFPQVSMLSFELTVAAATENEELLRHLHQTLDRMARGGIYDQIGGGFHRYSVDERWLVPHFEKMLYDNGQLLALYADAVLLQPEHPSAEHYRLVLRETAEYLRREMLDETGAFWSAQDAEVDSREGKNYLWRSEELPGVIEDVALRGLAERMFGLDIGTNFQDPHHSEDPPANVLFLPVSLDELAQREGVPMAGLLERRDSARALMLAARQRREQPSTDDKVLVAWNGMAIAGLARAGRALEDAGMVDLAAGAADAILMHLSREGGGLWRTMRRGQKQIAGYLDDYAFFVAGLIELARSLEGDRARRYLDEALRLMAYVATKFSAPGGGYLDSEEGASVLFVRTRSRHDGAVASGNAQMAHNLLDLYELTGESRWLAAAEALFNGFAESLAALGAAMVHMQHALLRLMGHRAGLQQRERVSSEASSGPIRVLVERVRVDEGAVRVSGLLVLEIEDGYHVNAPGAVEGLTGLALSTDRGRLDAEWPEPMTRKLAFSEEKLALYEGRLELPFVLEMDGDLEAGVNLLVRVQACGETACLSPVELRVSVLASTDSGVHG